MNVAISWDTEQCSSYINLSFGRTYHLHLQGQKSDEQETSFQQMARQVIRSYETPVHIRTALHYIPENGEIYSTDNLSTTTQILCIRQTLQQRRE
jgi:hypothetical protein